jgi:(2Fe-2S) ferredoxin
MKTRGMIAAPSGKALFLVVDDEFYRVGPTGERTFVGSLTTRRGTVGMKIGLTQLVIVDGVNGYVYDLESGAFSQITADGWLGSETVEYLDGYFTFIDPNTQTFYISAIEDAATLDPLDFATANASPDKLIGQITSGRVLVLFGEVSGEIWQDSGAADFPFERNSGSFLEVGLLARHTVKEMDNSVYWLGRDERGAGMVYRMEGFRPTRVSTMAIEQVIQKAITDGEDVSKAVAYTYQQDGHSFYVLQVPGLDTTWVYDASSQMWHERAELVDGDYAQHRGRFHAYAFGKHLIAGDDGIIYEYDVEANDNAGDVLVRDRISPHYATPSIDRLTFPRFELDCVVGEGQAQGASASVMLRYSNDGGFDWGSWRNASLGGIGERQARARFLRCGSARDRVWHVRVTDPVKFAIVNAVVDVE